MGYEIAGGLGAKMADPTREIFVMIGDGSYLMMSQEIITSIQEGYKLIIVLLNNNGFASIGGLSGSLGSQGFGTHYKYRSNKSGQLDGGYLPVDLATNAESYGALVLRTNTTDELNEALKQARQADRTTVIYLETDREHRVGGFGWWEVPISEVSAIKSINQSLQGLNENRKKKRRYL
jgi:3D-(3,5/4)-trihydroxycyclohexane-1,2-dione acylhydrolase (decyclizing)